MEKNIGTQVYQEKVKYVQGKSGHGNNNEEKGEIKLYG